MIKHTIGDHLKVSMEPLNFNNTRDQERDRSQVNTTSGRSIVYYYWIVYYPTITIRPKLDVFARTCYRIMLGINQKKDRLTNVELYKRVGNQRPVHAIIRERRAVRIQDQRQAQTWKTTAHVPETDFQLSEPRRWTFSPCGRNCQKRQEQVGLEASYCRA